MISLILDNPLLSKLKEKFEKVDSNKEKSNGNLNNNDTSSDAIDNDNTSKDKTDKLNFDLFKKKDSNGNNIEIDLDTIDNLNQQDVNTYAKQILNLATNFPDNYLQGKNGKTYHELEFFSTNDTTETTKSFFNYINKTQTTLGNHYLQNLLLNPITNIDRLKNRQSSINTINDSNISNIENDLKNISEIENQVLSIYRPDTEETKTVLDTVYFQFKLLQPLNYSQKFLNGFNYFIMFISPVYGIISPILILVTPILFMKYVLKIDVSLSNYLKLMKQMFFKSSTSSSVFFKVIENWNKNVDNLALRLMMKSIAFIIYIINSPFGRYGYLAILFISYIYSIYNYFTTTKSLNKIINYLHEKINKLVICIKTVKKYTKELINLIPYEENALELKLSMLFKHPLINSLIQEPLFTKKPSWFSNKGIILKTFKLIHDEMNRNSVDTEGNLFTPIFKYLGVLDAYYSISKLKLNNNLITYTNYIENSDVPYVNIEDLWNICCKDVVTNNLDLGKYKCLDNEHVNNEHVNNEQFNTNQMNNIIVTGPNGSGKSTYIKSILEALILSQTIGIAFCSSISITPFHNFITHLNIPDCQGKESLFQAEMNRCYSYLNQLNTIETNKEFSFNIIDEIFVSTNYLEGISGAYAIIKKLSNYNNSLSIVTTHFDVISKMNHNNTKKQYFSLDVSEDGSISGNYKIKDGVNKKHMALKLLRKKGFDNELINDAENMYSYLTSSNTSDNLIQLDNKDKDKNIENNVEDETVEDIGNNVEDETVKDETVQDNKDNLEDETVEDIENNVEDETVEDETIEDETVEDETIDDNKDRIKVLNNNKNIRNKKVLNNK